MSVKVKSSEAITLVADPDVNIYRCIADAKKFCRKHDLDSLDLEYRGFTFLITRHCRVQSKVNQFNKWLSYKNKFDYDKT